MARFADRVDSIFSTGLDVFGLPGRPENQRLFHRLQSFDSIVSWYGAGRPDFREFIQSLGLPFEFHQALPPEGIGLHAVDYYLTQVGAPCGAAPAIFTRRKPLDAIVIHPFSGSTKKNWTLERFRQLAAALAAEGLGPVLWSAGPEDAIADAVRFDELGALADWLSGARLYIGNDSGISHLAAAVGVPVVALFGPTNPEIWAPRGPKVRVVRGSNGSVQSITVAEVLAAIREVRHTGPQSVETSAAPAARTR
ncbi:MAG: hypothetical protein JNL98_31905 [Bryobacterales bacterium]|nr:hypothetical protein [Bryobacterales bacterium]